MGDASSSLGVEVRKDSGPFPPTLLVVMPVFNEEASLAGVIEEWMLELRRWLDDFLVLAIDDGSKDRSLERLMQARDRHGARLEVHTRENRGHGASCLEGYREAVARGIPWVFQIDSDGQCDPRFFGRMWQMREGWDVIYGRRVGRDDGVARLVASWVLKMVLLLLEGVSCVDANSPYRLMRTPILQGRLEAAENVHLANVALAVMLRRDDAVRHASTSICFRKRRGGVASVRLAQLGRKALQLVSQLKKLRHEAR
jgi:glycosyltransferase involved in cell wall biosynthesis